MRFLFFIMCATMLTQCVDSPEVEAMLDLSKLETPYHKMQDAPDNADFVPNVGCTYWLWRLSNNVSSVVGAVRICLYGDED